jgi:hypothetical protein
VGDVERGPSLEGLIGAGEGPPQQGAEPVLGVARDPQPPPCPPLVGDAVGRVGPQELATLGPEQARVVGGLGGVAAEQAMAPEAVEVAGAGARRLRPGWDLLLGARELERPELGKQPREGRLVVARGVEVGEPREQLGQRGVVVARRVTLPVVDEQDPLGPLFVDVDEGDRESLEAELAGGEQDVVSGEDLARSAVATIGLNWP